VKTVHLTLDHHRRRKWNWLGHTLGVITVMIALPNEYYIEHKLQRKMERRKIWERDLRNEMWMADYLH